MKKIISLLIVLMLTPIMVFAQDLEVEAGITPDSPFYGIDVWWDEVRVRFTTNVEEKARLRLEIAEERLSKLKATEVKQEAMQFEARHSSQA